MCSVGKSSSISEQSVPCKCSTNPLRLFSSWRLETSPRVIARPFPNVRVLVLPQSPYHSLYVYPTSLLLSPLAFPRTLLHSPVGSSTFSSRVVFLGSIRPPFVRSYTWTWAYLVAGGSGVRLHDGSFLKPIHSRLDNYTNNTDCTSRLTVFGVLFFTT